MKKFLMIAVAAMAVASQAATISWQLSASPAADGYAKDQTALLFVGGASETFSYGGTEGLSLSDYVNALLADGTDTATSKALDTATTISGRSGVTTAAQTVDVSYAAGSDIVGMIVVLDGAGKYSGFSFATQIAGAGETQLVTASADSSTGGFQDLPGSGDDPGPGPGPGPVDPVPEPATGALALAGIALLFRRRKA